MSTDHVVASMVLAWAILGAILIALDWLGNPNRGSFLPQGDRRWRDRALRKADRARRRLEDDAAVRATLRDAYGASSMRLTWSAEKEDRVRRLDDALIVHDVGDRIGVVDVDSREVATIDYTRVDGDPLPNADAEWRANENDTTADDGDPTSARTPTDDAHEPAEPDPPRPVGWRVGVDPLALTRSGTEPSPATIRSRVWKNLGAGGGWDEDNLERLRAGKPPRRINPITGRTERASVDVTTGRPTWGSEPTDPFADDR